MTIPQFERFLLRLAPATERAVIAGLQAGGLLLRGNVVREIRAQGLVDMATLVNSVTYTPVADGSIVAVEAPHAAPLEYGARPFFPPVAPLMAWALRKGLATDEASAKAIAFAIRGKIAKEGIAPRAFFRRAFARTLPQMQAAIDRECVRVGWRVTLSARRVLRSLGV